MFQMQTIHVILKFQTKIRSLQIPIANSPIRSSSELKKESKLEAKTWTNAEEEQKYSGKSNMQ